MARQGRRFALSRECPHIKIEIWVTRFCGFSQTSRPGQTGGWYVMTQRMPRMSLLSTILIFMITAVRISTAQQTKVISPPEFANQGKDDLPFSPGILVGDTLYVSGEIGFDLHTGQIPKDFDAEVKA